MTTPAQRLKEWVEAEKHLQGQHNQRRHGWRYGSLTATRHALQGQNEAERAEYRKRAGMSEPKKVEKKPEVAPKPKGFDTSITKDDLEGFKKQEYKVKIDGNPEGGNLTGYVKGHYGVTDGNITHIPSGRWLANYENDMAAKLAVSSMLKNDVLSDTAYDAPPKSEIDRYLSWRDKTDANYAFDKAAETFKKERAAERAAELEKLAVYRPTPRSDKMALQEYSKGEGTIRPSDSQKWENAKFEIASEAGKREVTGIVKGDFGIHKSPSGIATLTHLPTGMSVVRLPNVAAARKIGGAFARAKLPFITDLRADGGKAQIFLTGNMQRFAESSGMSLGDYLAQFGFVKG